MLLLLSLPVWQPHGLATFAVALFAFGVGHALADFAFQGDFLSQAKNRHADLARFFGENGQPPRGIWIHALNAHALIHAGAVWLISGSFFLAAVEFILHWIIDYAKCEGWTNFTFDQVCHLTCKVVYSALLATGTLSHWIHWTP